MTPEIVTGHDREIAVWTAVQLGLPTECFDPCSAYGVALGGDVIAGIVYNEFRIMKHGKSLQASMASTSPKWCSRPILRTIFGYPFLHLKVDRLWVMTGRRMKHVRSINERLGFRYEGKLRRQYDGRQDGMIYSMLPHECPWISA